MTANVQAVASSFKSEILQGIHNLGVGVTRGTTAADTIKAALYLQNASLGATTTAYSATNEVSGAGYTAGGATVSNTVAPALSGPTAYWTPSANVVWSSVTLSSLFDCALFYNSTQGNRAIGTYTFPAQTIVAGNFTLTMPTNSATTALLQVN